MNPRVLEERIVSALVDTVTAVLLAHPAPATPERVLDALTAPDVDALGLSGPDLLPGLVNALEALTQGGDLSTVPGGYATPVLPVGLSNRQRVLSLCGRTAIAHERAVRVSDVWSYVQQYAPDEIRVAGLTLGRLTRGLCSLKETGSVVAVGITQGDSTKGRNLLVPRALLQTGGEWTPREPLAWLDYVRGQVEQLARACAHPGRAAATFSTAEVRARLNADRDARGPVAQHFGIDLGEPMAVTSALMKLAAWSDPFLRRIPGRKAMWALAGSAVPVTMTEETLSYACDTDRVHAAALRAMRHVRRPAVTAREIAAAISADPALALTGTSGLAGVLADMVKRTIASGRGPRTARRDRRMLRVGKLDKQVAYWAASGTDDEASLAAAHALVAAQGVVHTIAELRLRSRLAALNDVVAPVIAIGRARLLAADIARVAPTLAMLSTQDPEVADAAAELHAVQRDVQGWLKFRGSPEVGAPVGVEDHTVGLSGDELRALFAPLTPTAARMTSAAQAVTGYSHDIRRILNTSRAARGGMRTKGGAEWLFDHTDALVYAALHWGGRKCNLFAMWGHQELGELRDTRYVIAAASSPSAESRRKAMMALALLDGPGVVDTVLDHLRNDTNAGVREAALWSVGMLLREAADDVVAEVRREDEHPAVRRAAEEARAVGASWWWRV